MELYQVDPRFSPPTESDLPSSPFSSAPQYNTGLARITRPNHPYDLAHQQDFIQSSSSVDRLAGGLDSEGVSRSRTPDPAYSTRVEENTEEGGGERFRDQEEHRRGKDVSPFEDSYA